MSARGNTQRAGQIDRATDVWLGVVAQVATMPGVIRGLAEQHVDDGTGRCRVCTYAGQQNAEFPCKLASLAEEAGKRRRRRPAS